MTTIGATYFASPIASVRAAEVAPTSTDEIPNSFEKMPAAVRLTFTVTVSFGTIWLEKVRLWTPPPFLAAYWLPSAVAVGVSAGSACAAASAVASAAAWVSRFACVPGADVEDEGRDREQCDEEDGGEDGGLAGLAAEGVHSTSLRGVLDRRPDLTDHPEQADRVRVRGRHRDVGPGRPASSSTVIVSWLWSRLAGGALDGGLDVADGVRREAADGAFACAGADRVRERDVVVEHDPELDHSEQEDSRESARRVRTRSSSGRARYGIEFCFSFSGDFRLMSRGGLPEEPAPAGDVTCLAVSSRGEGRRRCRSRCERWLESSVIAPTTAMVIDGENDAVLGHGLPLLTLAKPAGGLHGGELRGDEELQHY